MKLMILEIKGKIADFYFRKSPILYQYERNLGDIVKELSYLQAFGALAMFG